MTEQDQMSILAVFNGIHGGEALARALRDERCTCTESNNEGEK